MSLKACISGMPKWQKIVAMLVAISAFGAFFGSLVWLFT